MILLTCRSRGLRTLALASCLFGAAPAARADLGVRIPLDQLAEHADLIVVAVPTTITEVPSGSLLNLQITRVVASHAESIEKPVAVAARFDGLRGAVPTTVTGMWFLKAGSDGSGVYNVLPVARSARVPFLDDGFVRVLPSAPTESVDPAAARIDLAVVVLRDAMASTDEAVSAPAFEAALSMLESPSPRTLLHEAEPGASHHCNARALARDFDGLVAGRVLAALQAARPVAGPFVQALCAVSDPTATEVAGQVLAWPTAALTVRRCAAQALRNIHTLDALAPLSAVLGDPDLDIRFLAVQGFSLHANGYAPVTRGVPPTSISNQTPLATSQTRRRSPSFEAFAASPSTYTAFWQNWWACEPCRLDRGTPTVEVASAGECSGPTCSLQFLAAAGDPDGDAIELSWSGCATGSGSSLGCTVAQPGIYSAQADVRDVHGETATAFREVAVFGAQFSTGAWSSCNGSGTFTCTSAGPAGCTRPGERSRTVAATSLTTNPGAAVPVPPSIEGCTQTVAGYVETWTTGPWSECSAPCGGGTQTRSVTAVGWDTTGPSALAPDSSQPCNTHQCVLTCYDYTDMYPTQGECYGAGWGTCEIRYRPDGIGGTLTCWKGFP